MEPSFVSICCLALWNFLMGNNDNIEVPPILKTCISTNFKLFYGPSYGQTLRKKLFSTKSRSRKMMVKFLKSFGLLHVKNTVELMEVSVINFFHVNMVFFY